MPMCINVKYLSHNQKLKKISLNMPYFIVATEIVNTKLCLTFILFAGIIADGLDSGVRY
jgi:hypothetical protein